MPGTYSRPIPRRRHLTYTVKVCRRRPCRTELIGYENQYSSALMDAIYCGSNGKAWNDSRFNGIFSRQYTQQERLYGFDPVMYYLDFYFPKFFDRENLRVGRYISIPDIEAQLAPTDKHFRQWTPAACVIYTMNGLNNQNFGLPNYQHDAHNIWTWSTDYMDDSTGQRSQAMLAMDVVFHF